MALEILVVDDEGDVRDLVAFNLQRNGMSTIFAKDGIEACVLFEAPLGTA